MNAYFRFNFSLPEVLAIGTIINGVLAGESWLTISMLVLSILGACGRAIISHIEVEKLLEIQEKMQALEQDTTQQFVTMVTPSPSGYEN